MIYKIIATSLALIPFFVWFGWDEGIRTPKEVASIIALLAIVGVSLFNHSLKPFKNRWLLLFGGWCFFTTLIGITTPVFLDKIVLHLPPNLIAYKSLFYICLSIMAVVCLASIPIDLKKISRVINWTVIALCLYGVIQLFGLDEFFRVADQATGWIGKTIWEDLTDCGALSHRVVATLGNPSIFGIFLAMCLPFSIYRFREEGKFSFILSLLIISLTISTTAIVGTLVALLFYFFFTNKKVFIALLIVTILLGGLAIYKFNDYFNPTGRIEMLKESWKVLEKKPLTGMGLGSFEQRIGNDPEVFLRLNKQNWREAHNEFFQIFFEGGLVGLILILFSIFSTFRRFIKNINIETIILASSIIVIFMASITYFPFRVGPLAFYSVMIYGLFENKIGEIKCQ